MTGDSWCNANVRTCAHRLLLPSETTWVWAWSTANNPASSSENPTSPSLGVQAPPCRGPPSSLFKPSPAEDAATWHGRQVLHIPLYKYWLLIWGGFKGQIGTETRATFSVVICAWVTKEPPLLIRAGCQVSCQLSRSPALTENFTMTAPWPLGWNILPVPRHRSPSLQLCPSSNEVSLCCLSVQSTSVNIGGCVSVDYHFTSCFRFLRQVFPFTLPRLRLDRVWFFSSRPFG